MFSKELNEKTTAEVWGNSDGKPHNTKANINIQMYINRFTLANQKYYAEKYIFVPLKKVTSPILEAIHIQTFSFPAEWALNFKEWL